MSLLDKIKSQNLPSHIAIIMDGNGRWAQERGLSRSKGHEEGVVAIKRVVEAAANARIDYLTVYAFSTENWNRPAEEVDALMELMVYSVVKETPELIKQGVRLLAIGDCNRLPAKTQEALNECLENTKNGKTITVVLALSYSSKWEITQAIKKVADDIEHDKILKEDISETLISKYLSTQGIPDPDLLIRTGGEKRISNFLLWQLAYAELYFTDTYWPDFNAEHLYKAILDFQCRERRFGKTSEQIKEEQKEIRKPSNNTEEQR